MALRAFSASCAASHEPLAAVASSSASYRTVTFVILVSSIAILIEFTISTVCVRDAPVMGKLEMILTVLAVDAPVVPPVPAPPHAPMTSARAVMAAAADVQRLCMLTLPSGLIGYGLDPGGPSPCADSRVIGQVCGWAPWASTKTKDHPC